jgi:hypothetical protein
MVLWELHYRQVVIQYPISLREEDYTLRKALFSLEETEFGVPEGDVTSLRTMHFCR